MAQLASDLSRPRARCLAVAVATAAMGACAGGGSEAGAPLAEPDGATAPVPPVVMLAFSVQPGPAVAGEVWSPAPTVALTAGGTRPPVADPNGGGPQVVLSLGPDDGPLSGTTRRPWTGGQVVFPGLMATRHGAKTLTASLVDAAGVPLEVAAPVSAAPFTVSAGAATTLLFAEAAAQAAAGTLLSPAPRWLLLDDFQNPAPLAAGATVALGLAGGSAALRGAEAVSVAAGTVVFTGVDVDTAGTYQLQATLTRAGGSVVSPADATLAVTPGVPVTAGALADDANGLQAAVALQVDDGAVHLPLDRQDQAQFAPGAAAPQGLALDAARGGLTLGVTDACSAAASQCTVLDPAWAPRSADLVGHWRLDGSGPVADGAAIGGSIGPDLHAANADGAGLGYAAGHLGGALVLDGVDDAILLPSSLFGGAAMTIALWARVDEARDEARLLEIAHDADNYIGLLTSAGGLHQVNLAGGSGPSSASVGGVAVGVWQHLVVTLDGTTSTVYLNGNAVSACSSAVTPAAFVADHSTLGRSVLGGPLFRGALDEVAVWQVALTGGEVAALYGRQASPRGGTWTSAPMPFSPADLGWHSLAWQSRLPAGKPLGARPESTVDYPDLAATSLADGLTFLWHLDEPVLASVGGGGGSSGDLADFADSAGADNHAHAANFQGAAAVLADRSGPGAAGPLGRAVALGHASPGPSVTTRQVAPGLASFSVQVWFASGGAEGGRIIGFGDGGAGPTSDPALRADRHLYLTPTGTLAFGIVHQSSQQTLLSPTSLADGRWHHALGTVGPDGMSLWVDGQRVVHNPGVPTADVYPGGWRLGWEDFANSAWTQAPQRGGLFGLVAEAAVWSRALSGDEALALYRRGSERIRLQLRACADPGCLAEPPWQGPDGTPQTMFSELDNADAAGFRGHAPRLPLWRNGHLPALADAPYMQMLVQMDAADLVGLCHLGGAPAPCRPTLTGAQVAAAQAASAAAATFELQAPPRVLTSFSQTLGEDGCAGGVGYALSLDGATFWVYGGGGWTPVDAQGASATPATDLDGAALLAFGRQVGVPGARLLVRAYPRPAGAAGCALAAVAVGGHG